MSGTSAPRGTVSIVLVDDHPEVRVLVRTALRLHGGFEVVGEAADGATAVALSAAMEPDVVVLDLGLPDLAGREVLTTIRQRSPLSKLVVFTGTHAESEGVAERADAFVLKDEDVGYLVELIANLGRTARQHAEVYLAEESSSVALARDFARSALASWNMAYLSETVALVVSELVTNALLHARSACRMRLSIRPNGVRVEVYDRGSGTPDPRPSDADSEHGRGLQLITTFASAWGTEVVAGDGKLVWAEVTGSLEASGQAESAGGAGGLTASGCSAQRSEVVRGG